MIFCITFALAFEDNGFQVAFSAPVETGVWNKESDLWQDFHRQRSSTRSECLFSKGDECLGKRTNRQEGRVILREGTKRLR